MLDEPPELIPVDKQSDDQIVHAFSLRKANRPAHQPLDPRPQINVFALDLLCVCLSHCVPLCLYMPLVGTPAVGVKATNPEGRESGFELQ